MSRPTIGIAGWKKRTLKRLSLVAIAGALILPALVGAQTPPPQATGLSFFKNYTITGDYQVAGVNLRGTGDSSNDLATGIINSSGTEFTTVPVGADLVGAFLYWTTVQTPNSATGADGATFRGKLPSQSFGDLVAVPRHDISLLAKVLNPSGSAPCWSSGGGTGESGGAHKMFAYRADVLRFIPIDPISGKRVVNTQFEVRLADQGTGNKVPSTAGASLVVIYRDPTKPLTSIVLYNGGYTMDNSTQQMTRTLTGFYDAGTSPGISSITAKLTHIVGDGSVAKSDRLQFGSGDGTTLNELGRNVFQGAASSPSSDPAWDNLTIDVSSHVLAHASSVTTKVDPDPQFSPFDCLSWGAIIFSTTVDDSDNDGIADVLEQPLSGRTAATLNDPTGRPLPDLYGMGARDNHKDVFVEIGALKTDTAYSTPFQGNVAIHNHMFSQAALDLVGDAFKNAPISNIDGIPGIKIHFDVGNRYQTNDPYIVPSSLARGGEQIIETACVGESCSFPNYPGTVGWKTGFRFLRDQPLNYTDEAACQAAEAAWTQYLTSGGTQPTPPDCLRRFDHVRKDTFHYALSAHALGVQRLDDPNTPENESIDAQPPALGSPLPNGSSGVGDGGGSGGGDLMVTLGFWDDFVGTDFVQASTLMHELGHNFRFRHGGTVLDTNGQNIFQPNCKPNYQSVMSYLFQIRGLIVGAANTPVTGYTVGTAKIDYSRQELGPLNEDGLSEPAGLGTSWNYRTRWYSPASPVDLTLGTSPVTRHCNGSFLGAGEQGLFRQDGTTVTAPLGVDWNVDSIYGSTLVHQDITFSGLPLTALDHGSNDWSMIDLRQVGARRNVARQLDPACNPATTECPQGPLSVDQGQGDQGQGDQGQGDQGQGDQGQGDQGQGDQGQGDQGQGDQGQGDQGAPGGDLTFDDAAGQGNPPNSLTATVTQGPKNILLTWTPPHVRKNHVVSYEVWRILDPNDEGITTAPNGGTFASRVLVGTTSALTLTDFNASNNTWYTYWVQANFDSPPLKSGRSTTVRIKK